MEKLLDIPIGTICVEQETSCKDCIFDNTDRQACDTIACLSKDRKDGKNVIFKLIEDKTK